MIADGRAPGSGFFAPTKAKPPLGGAGASIQEPLLGGMRGAALRTCRIMYGAPKSKSDAHYISAMKRARASQIRDRRPCGLPHPERDGRPVGRLRPALLDLHQPVDAFPVRLEAAAGVAVALTAGEFDALLRQLPGKTRDCASAREACAQHGHGVLLRSCSEDRAGRADVP